MKRRSFLASLSALSALPFISFKKEETQKVSSILPKKEETQKVPLFYQCNQPAFGITKIDLTHKVYCVNTHTWDKSLKSFVQKYSKKGHVVIYKHEKMGDSPYLYIRAAVMDNDKDLWVWSVEPRYDYRLNDNISGKLKTIKINGKANNTKS